MKITDIEEIKQDQGRMDEFRSILSMAREIDKDGISDQTDDSILEIYGRIVINSFEQKDQFRGVSYAFSGPL